MIGPEERGVRDSLKQMPTADPALAAMMLAMAKRLDAGDMSDRDAIAARGQVRQCVTQLREWAPGEVQGDRTDEVRERRERRLAIPE